MNPLPVPVPLAVMAIWLPFFFTFRMDSSSVGIVQSTVFCSFLTPPWNTVASRRTVVFPFEESATVPLLSVTPVMDSLYSVGSVVTTTVVCACISLSVPVSVAVTRVSPDVPVSFDVTVAVLVSVLGRISAIASLEFVQETSSADPAG